jgi:hypothetical protein
VLKSTPGISVLAIAFVLAFAGLASAQSVAARGESCGGVTGAQCAEGLWCDPLPGLCGAPLRGKCVSVPQACTMEYKPVCGCNGKSIANDCVRRAAKVGLLHPGSCAADIFKAK